MKPLIDISGKLDADIIDCIAWMHRVCSEMGLPVLLIGALARDIHFLHRHGILPGRATMDVDFAVLMPDWDTFEDTMDRLLTHPGYMPDRLEQQRLRTNTGLAMDIIPFGGLEAPAGTVRWPPAFSHAISTIGFADALRTSRICRVRTAPTLDTRIVSIAGIAALKLLSWADGYPERQKDAIDLRFLLLHYLDAGQRERLWEDEMDLLEAPGFDYEQAGARLLGRDVGRMASPDTRRRLMDLLREELRTAGRHRLIGQWHGREGEDETASFDILEQFFKGIGETGMGKETGD
jgi:predicted nucleotidyltransferase